MRAVSLALFFVVTITPSLAHALDRESIEKQLRAAVQAGDESAVRAAVAQAVTALGAKAGKPEVPDTYARPTDPTARLTRKEARQGLRLLHDQLPRKAWWKIGIDPSKTEHALREIASALHGFLAASRALECEHCLIEARKAGDFLLWAQSEAGAGVLPFPAYRGHSDDNAFRAAKRALDAAEKQGRIQEMVRNGWVYADLGNGGLQFDNGEAGVALFALFEQTADERYLKGAKAASDWALSQPLVENWNYNSFSVYLLANAYRVTGEQKYLTSAIHKARVGVIPGQLTSGVRAGRWFDPHNARPAYHYIMLRGLTALLQEIPPTKPQRGEIRDALALGLKSRNCEFESRGVTSPDKAIEVLLLVHRAFPGERMLVDSCCDVSLGILEASIAEEARKGKFPLGPGELGEYLEYRLGSEQP